MSRCACTTTPRATSPSCRSGSGLPTIYQFSLMSSVGEVADAEIIFVFGNPRAPAPMKRGASHGRKRTPSRRNPPRQLTGRPTVTFSETSLMRSSSCVPANQL